MVHLLIYLRVITNMCNPPTRRQRVPARMTGSAGGSFGTVSLHELHRGCSCVIYIARAAVRRSRLNGATRPAIGTCSGSFPTSILAVSRLMNGRGRSWFFQAERQEITSAFSCISELKFLFSVWSSMLIYGVCWKLQPCPNASLLPKYGERRRRRFIS